LFDVDQLNVGVESRTEADEEVLARQSESEEVCSGLEIGSKFVDEIKRKVSELHGNEWKESSGSV
jgi:hypothetical protein